MEDEELDKELNQKEQQFEQEIKQLWNDGLLVKTYNDAIELARKHGYIIKNPIPVSTYTTHIDINDYRVDLYSSSNKHLMQLIFEQSKSKRLPFRLKTFHLFKQ